MIVNKCKPGDPNTAVDAECTNGVQPYFKTYTVVIFGKLNDMMVTESQVSFDVTIGPNCDDDFLGFQSLVQSQLTGPYLLGINEAYIMPLDPELAQNTFNCPVKCQLTSFDSMGPIFDFNDQTGVTIIKTQDPSLNMQTLTYTVECVSQLSQAQLTPIEQTFDVTFAFEQCNASIFLLDTSGMPNYTQNWFDPTQTTKQVPQFQYSADCSLEFTYTAIVNVGNDVWKDVSEVPEITFDAQALTFDLAKCYPATFETLSNDPECGSDAYFFTYEVAVIATLNDGEGTFDDSIRFQVTFGPDCTGDIVYFNQEYASPQVYYITNPPTTAVFDHQLVQDVPNCPVTCSLRQDGSDGYSDASIASFSSTTGAFSISEFNFERDTFQMDLSLECVSDLSESFVGSSSNSFTLQLLDVCRTADLSIADLSPSTMPTMLWPVPVDYFSFSGLESSLPCGPYTYYIRSDPAIADGLSISGFSNLSIQA